MRSERRSKNVKCDFFTTACKAELKVLCDEQNIDFRAFTVN